MLKFEEIIEREVPRDDAADYTEQMILYWLIRAIKPKFCVETGTHKGVSTLYMAHALYDNGFGEILTTDPYEWGQVGNLQKIPELQPFIKYQFVKGEELKIDKEIDFLFLDGFHEYDVIRREIDHLFPHLSKHAVVIFHDAAGDGNEVGTNQAVRDAGLTSVWLPTPNCIRIYCKTDSPPFGRHAILDKNS